MKSNVDQDGGNPPNRCTPRHAPWFTVPQISIVSVEHPYIIKNTDKAIVSLGGEGKMSPVGPSKSRGPENALTFPS